MEYVCTRSRTEDLWCKKKHVFTSSAFDTKGGSTSWHDKPGPKDPQCCPLLLSPQASNDVGSAEYLSLSIWRTCVNRVTCWCTALANRATVQYRRAVLFSRAPLIHSDIPSHFSFGERLF
ncbi:hypothetical protein TNCV_2090631 [Trichonephila clavipes]|nr:hypothetical protein TNCV_2090631 [Trichonephila clavipes]